MILQNLQEVEKDKKWLIDEFQSIKQKSELCFILSDTTRIKILMLLNKHSELCVTDLSITLNISISAMSHQLSLIEKSNLVKKVKDGQRVCYSIDDKGNDMLSLFKSIELM